MDFARRDVNISIICFVSRTQGCCRWMMTRQTLPSWTMDGWLFYVDQAAVQRLMPSDDANLLHGVTETNVSTYKFFRLRFLVKLETLVSKMPLLVGWKSLQYFWGYPTRIYCPPEAWPRLNLIIALISEKTHDIAIRRWKNLGYIRLTVWSQYRCLMNGQTDGFIPTSCSS